MDTFLLKNLEDIQKDDMVFYKKLGINKNELNSLNKGEEVYLCYNRLKELLENQTK